jgi:hypothetical protein
MSIRNPRRHALHVLAYDLTRVMNIMGSLLAAMRA